MADQNKKLSRGGVFYVNVLWSGTLGGAAHSLYIEFCVDLITDGFAVGL